jgi:DNA-binding response OmpR family regulator
METRDVATPCVVLANDTPADRALYADTLRASGYCAIEAATSVAAYDCAINRPTALVVADAHIAGSMNGLELTRRLRINARTAVLPIIVLTSASRPHDGDLALKAGANAILQKPVSADVLREQVARLLHQGNGSPAENGGDPRYGN